MGKDPKRTKRDASQDINPDIFFSYGHDPNSYIVKKGAVTKLSFRDGLFLYLWRGKDFGCCSSGSCPVTAATYSS